MTDTGGRTDAVKQYFDRAADDFDAIYGGKGAFACWLNRNFRSDMYERYRLTFETCGDVAGKSVLDVGCGRGRYSIEFARRGADHVVGLDFAPGMVDLARRHAPAFRVEDRCDFVAGDFMQLEFKSRFDICIAIGVMDYIAQPRPFLEKMRSLAGTWMFVTFPSTSPVRTPIRKVRYFFKRCPVYFYDQQSIQALVQGLGNCQILKIPGQGMDYFVSLRARGLDGDGVNAPGSGNLPPGCRQ